MAASQPLAYGSILAGSLLLVAGVTGSTLTSVAKGAPDRQNAPAGKALEGPGAGAGTANPYAPSPGSSAGGNFANLSPSAGAHPGKGGTSAMKGYLRTLAKAAGWNQTEVAAWENVIERESGWSTTAANSSTGAYGIGQINPENARNPHAPKAGSTAAAYPGYDSPSWKVQLGVMALYIKRTYGSPIAALASEHARGYY